jgi:hypothetical protein
MTNTDRALRRVPVCGAQTTLAPALVNRSLALAGPGNAQAEDVEVILRCALQAHSDGEHHAFVLQLDGTRAEAVWAAWTDEPPTAVELRPDCAASGLRDHGSHPCCEYAGHPGAHTYDVHDPLAYPSLTRGAGTR